MHKYKTQYWSLNVPAQWDAEFSDGADVIYDNNGVGELVISTLFDENGIEDEQLEAMVAEHLDFDAELEDITIADFSGVMLSYTQDGEFWSEWYLRTDKLLIFASYNCDESQAEEDDDIVEAIMASLEVVT